MPLLNFKKFSNSFIVPTIILVLITLAASTIITSVLERSKQKAALNQTINNTFRLAEYSAMDPLWNYNVSAIQSLGDALMEATKLLLMQDCKRLTQVESMDISPQWVCATNYSSNYS